MPLDELFGRLVYWWRRKFAFILYIFSFSPCYLLQKGPQFQIRFSHDLASKPCIGGHTVFRALAWQGVSPNRLWARHLSAVDRSVPLLVLAAPVGLCLSTNYRIKIWRDLIALSDYGLDDAEIIKV